MNIHYFVNHIRLNWLNTLTNLRFIKFQNLSDEHKHIITTVDNLTFIFLCLLDEVMPRLVETTYHRSFEICKEIIV